MADYVIVFSDAINSNAIMLVLIVEMVGEVAAVPMICLGVNLPVCAIKLTLEIIIEITIEITIKMTLNLRYFLKFPKNTLFLVIYSVRMINKIVINFLYLSIIEY